MKCVDELQLYRIIYLSWKLLHKISSHFQIEPHTEWNLLQNDIFTQEYLEIGPVDL